MATLFFSYSHKDEELRNRLDVALRMLQRQGLIETWHDRRILAGDEIDPSIDANLEAADIVLLLVSPDFIASDYCYDREMERAMERHRSGKARVIPVILRPCDWHQAPFGKLMATPPDGKPIRSFADLDEAFQAVSADIRRAIENGGTRQPAPPERAMFVGAGPLMPISTPLGPRSSNLSLPKTFTDRDRDHFLEDSFTYIEAYFVNSLTELKARNEGIDTGFRKIDNNRFNATIYQNGRDIAHCWISLSDVMGKGIAYSTEGRSNGYNEQLRVESDDHGLFLKNLGFASRSDQRDPKLTQEGGAELFWEMLIRPLQGGGW